jgi:NAD dependent epimerase/dehydratase family enzyme
VHIHDLAEAFLFLLSHPGISGPVNICAPNPGRNRDLARALGNVLHRPSSLPAPAFMVRLLLGEFGSVILKGQRVVPRRLADSGFVFRYPLIEEALASIIQA